MLKCLKYIYKYILYIYTDRYHYHLQPILIEFYKSSDITGKERHTERDKDLKRYKYLDALDRISSFFPNNTIL